MGVLRFGAGIIGCGDLVMKISKAWIVIGYVVATTSALHFGGFINALIALWCCVYIDMASWASSWKEFR